MAAVNRNDQIARLQKVARKHFQPAKTSSDRTVFETLIFGCCLENATFEQAEEAFARLQENYFDWNEVRVTTVPELAESMVGFIDPQATATRVKRSLHAIFETHYAFDLESLHKENLGKALEKLKGYKGVTEFASAYVAQTSLGGHTIPLDEATLKLCEILDLASPKDLAASTVPGLERAVPKAKGAEFFSTVHQLAVQWFAAPNSTKTWAIIAEIDGEARSRHNLATKAAAEAATIAAAESAAKAEAARAARAATPRPAQGKPGSGKPGSGKPNAPKPGSGKPGQPVVPAAAKPGVTSSSKPAAAAKPAVPAKPTAPVKPAPAKPTGPTTANKSKGEKSAPLASALNKRNEKGTDKPADKAAAKPVTKPADKSADKDAAKKIPPKDSGKGKPNKPSKDDKSNKGSGSKPIKKSPPAGHSHKGNNKPKPR